MISNFRAGTIIKMSTLSLSRLWLFQLGSLARVNTVKLPSRGKTRIYRRLWATASASSFEHTHTSCSLLGYAVSTCVALFRCY